MWRFVSFLCVSDEGQLYELGFLVRRACEWQSVCGLRDADDCYSSSLFFLSVVLWFLCPVLAIVND